MESLLIVSAQLALFMLPVAVLATEWACIYVREEEKL